MKCSVCSNKAVFSSPDYCKEHFSEYVENKVKKTISDFKLIEKNEKICVAVSGGKDSVSLLFILKKLGYNVEALAIDEGIQGYRNITLDFLKRFCEEHKIHLVIKSYEQDFGKRLDRVVKKGEPACNICGTFRRHLLNKYSQEYSKIATGHNLDDEAQAVLMNLFKAQTEMLGRQGPKTSKKDFVRKIKPLYFLKEKEIMAYAFLNKLNVPFIECPFASESFRGHIRDWLNNLETKNPGTKENIVRHYLSLAETLKNDSSLDECPLCGFPSSKGLCHACRLKMRL
ncbi:MAG: TIGR00269 family protein [Candidatus Nanoarchaeia archaeon]